jgi:hypothetical protein
MHPTARWPDQVGARFAPWHGFPGTYGRYGRVMRRSGHLHLVGVQFRLPPGDDQVYLAAKKWQDVFGVPMVGATMTFTNATMEFLKGEEGKREGLETITIAVEGKGNLEGILERAKQENILRDGLVDMCGIKWKFVYKGEPKKSKL